MAEGEEMTRPDPLADLQARFVWTRDKRDRWTLLDAPTGPLCGDCEDWSYTALWLCAGKSWGRFWWLVCMFQAWFWLTRVHGTGELHFMLWVRGRGWTDNIHPEWSAKPHHPRMVPYLPPLLAFVLLIKSKRKQNV